MATGPGIDINDLLGMIGGAGASAGGQGLSSALGGMASPGISGGFMNALASLFGRGGTNPQTGAQGMNPMLQMLMLGLLGGGAFGGGAGGGGGGLLQSLLGGGGATNVFAGRRPPRSFTSISGLTGETLNALQNIREAELHNQLALQAGQIDLAKYNENNRHLEELGAQALQGRGIDVGRELGLGEQGIERQGLDVQQRLGLGQQDIERMLGMGQQDLLRSLGLGSQRVEQTLGLGSQAVEQALGLGGQETERDVARTRAGAIRDIFGGGGTNPFMGGGGSPMPGGPGGSPMPGIPGGAPTPGGMAGPGGAPTPGGGDFFAPLETNVMSDLASPTNLRPSDYMGIASRGRQAIDREANAAGQAAQRQFSRSGLGMSPALLNAQGDYAAGAEGQFANAMSDAEIQDRLEKARMRQGLYGTLFGIGQSRLGGQQWRQSQALNYLYS